jgi:twitching motility protein PilT
VTGKLACVRFDEVLYEARRHGASDAHLCAQSVPVLRIGGTLVQQSPVALSVREVDDVLALLLDHASQQAYCENADVTSTYRASSGETVRVHAYKTSRGPCLALRFLPSRVPSVHELQLPEGLLRLAAETRGLILFAGSTGSGKTTALAALVNEINSTSRKHVITIEDPIEFIHEPMLCSIQQREVGRDVASYAAGVYGALRSDPDVVIIGEMRHAVTMEAALLAAETGHLVMGTLHTRSAADTIERIIGAFEGSRQAQARLQLAQCLLAVVCLQLVPRAGGNGRVAIAELLLATDAVRNLIRDAKTHQIQNVLETSRQLGMHTFDAHRSELSQRGVIA